MKGNVCISGGTPTTGIVGSGLWEKRHPVPNAAPWTDDWGLRAHGRVRYDLAFEKWWTSVNTAAGRNGVAKVRGFPGDCTVGVRSGSKTIKAPVKFGIAGVQVEIEL